MTDSLNKADAITLSELFYIVFYSMFSTYFFINLLCDLVCAYRNKNIVSD